VARPVTVNIPHSLGKEEARRRIADGFGRLQQQMTSGIGAMVSMQERWEGDRLHFEGSGLGQKISGRLDVRDDSVQIQLDLPEILAAIADRISGKLQKEGQKLLEKKWFSIKCGWTLAEAQGTQSLCFTPLRTPRLCVRIRFSILLRRDHEIFRSFSSCFCVVDDRLRAKVEPTEDSTKVEIEVPKVEVNKTPDLNPATDDDVDIDTKAPGDS
jgi:hypothetical protein